MSTPLEQIAQDLRFGARILTKSPGLSATAVLLIALVIGGNTTVFSIAHAILDKPMPGVRGTGLTAVSWVADDGFVQSHHTYRVYAFLREHTTTLQAPAAVDFQRADDWTSGARRVPKPGACRIRGALGTAAGRESRTARAGRVR